MNKKLIICLACKSNNVSFLIKVQSSHGKSIDKGKGNFTYFSCSDCNAIFLEGVEFNKNYYKKYYNFSEFLPRTGLLKNLEDMLNRRSLNWKLKLVSENASGQKKKLDLLDIGCGKGEFLSSIDKTKYN